MKTLIHTPTPNFSRSLEFYQKLGFKVISRESPILVTDGSALIEINPSRFARAGVKVFREDAEALCRSLNPHVVIHQSGEGYLFDDPSGVRVYIEGGTGVPDVEGLSVDTGELGNFAGISLESADIERSMEVWKLLGFSNISGSVEQGWVSLANDEGLSISLMQPNSCPHLFFNPSLTYFNGALNVEIIARIRALGIPITEEITHFNKMGLVDNIIIRDPGGYGFFLFSD